MPVPIRMPKLGMSMQVGTVVAWPVPLGERVEKGAPLLVIESEKAEIEIEATAAGFLRFVYVEPGEQVACGTLLGVLTDAADEDFDPAAFRREHDPPEAPRRAKASLRPVQGVASPVDGLAAATRRKSLVTPSARARARGLGIDPTQVPGTGPGQRVTREDVERFQARRETLVPVANGVALEVLSEGEGDAVLLLPGFGVDVSVFARQTPALSDRFRVLGVNPRGVGLSDAPEQDCYSVATAAADAVAVGGDLFHVIGASLGAAVAIELALSSPERVRSLTLITPFVVAAPRLLSVIDAWCSVARGATPDVLARALLPWLFSDASLSDPGKCERALRGFAAMAGRVPPETLARSASGLRAWSGTRSAALSDLEAPTLVLGGGSDLLTPSVAVLAREIPGAVCRIVPAAGHALGLEAPDAVNQAVLKHLEGC